MVLTKEQCSLVIDFLNDFENYLDEETDEQANMIRHAIDYAESKTPFLGDE